MMKRASGAPLARFSRNGLSVIGGVEFDDSVHLPAFAGFGHHEFMGHVTNSRRNCGGVVLREEM